MDFRQWPTSGVDADHENLPVHPSVAGSDRIVWLASLAEAHGVKKEFVHRPDAAVPDHGDVHCLKRHGSVHAQYH